MPDENVINFRKKDKSRTDKFEEIIQSRNYVCFWFDDKGVLNYSFGENMSNREMTYVEKTLGIMVTDTLKENIQWEYIDGQ